MKRCCNKKRVLKDFAGVVHFSVRVQGPAVSCFGLRLSSYLGLMQQKAIRSLNLTLSYALLLMGLIRIAKCGEVG